MKKLALFSMLLCLSASVANAKENINVSPSSGPGNSGRGGTLGAITAGGGNCTNSRSKTELSVNNVRTLIFINGDMWWDLVGTATYEIPKNSRKYSLFSGAIWVGGLDLSGNLRVAAQTYRQSGQDFWPGPVDTINVTTDLDVCNAYDKHWKVSLQEVRDFRDYFNSLGGGAVNDALVPEAIKTWPGTGDQSLLHTKYLAPYIDNNNDGTYNFEDGDYPGFDLTAPQDCGDVLLGDQVLWWVFNDVGNIHTETDSPSPIGLEIQAQAFGFTTNDEINNMTFYKYKIINRNTTVTIDSCYFGYWVDPDLGNYNDDFVGCDVARGLGFCYNGDAVDEGLLGYGQNPPAVGVDFFEGPLANPNDGVDNDRDGTVDEPNELIIMSKFLYYNNDGDPVNGNPNNAPDYYNYLKGFWRNGTRVTYGGDGTGTTGVPCDFMFPSNTDPLGIGTGNVPQQPWDEINTLTGVPNLPADRRFLQSAGQFTLQPGAVNFITAGAVWARASNGGPTASIALLKAADDKAQVLFNSCFGILNGPDAPTLAVRELENEIIISIENEANSNNFNEEYFERDPYVIFGSPDSLYIFEGYQIYQLKDATVTGTREDLQNADKARLVAQCDVKNGTATIINFYRDPELGVWDPSLMVSGSDQGLRHTFRITKDLFATGDAELINHKTYYYTAIAYSYCPEEDNANPYAPGDGIENKPYLAGRRNIKTYSAIPHSPLPEANGLNLVSFYGDGPKITRIEGAGNGYNIGSDRKAIELTAESLREVAIDTDGDPTRVKYPVYERAAGPVNIQVYDPVKIKPGNFKLWLNGVGDASKWKLENINSGDVVEGVKSIGFPYDQLFPDYGFYISMNQTLRPGDFPAQGNGVVSASITYADPNRRWWTGVQDVDNTSLNWILSGTNTTGNTVTGSPRDAFYAGQGDTLVDGPQFFEKLINGTWAPFKLVSYDFATPNIAPGLNQQTYNQNDLRKTYSIDLIMTQDKSMWSRCAVIEAQPTATLAVGAAPRFNLRRSPSKDIDGNEIVGSTGLSYFPGYAVNVETGERLNIIFSEDSYQNNADGNGADMLFNPTSILENANGDPVLGGRHVIYVMANNDTVQYDGCEKYANRLRVGTAVALRNVFTNAMWVGYPLVTSGETAISSTTKISLRVTRPYQVYNVDGTSPEVAGAPYYTFSTADIAAVAADNTVAKSALDIINVVPNPYYAFSTYERNQLDNRVKLVNLPSRCTITIYSSNGTLIRRLSRDVPTGDQGTTQGLEISQLNLETSTDWDLKNFAGVPIASGVYIIHIEAPGIGEKTLKWFGVMRPTDLDVF